MMMDPAKGTCKGEAQPPLRAADFAAFGSDGTLDLFLLVGQSNMKGLFLHAREIDEVLLALPRKRSHTACVDARNLAGHIGDGMHDDLDSQMEIGRRFADAFPACESR